MGGSWSPKPGTDRLPVISRPFALKYTSPNGEEVYVPQVAGEVVQHTTRNLRIGAYFGAIPHWLYFTPLRKETGTGPGNRHWMAVPATQAGSTF